MRVHRVFLIVSATMLSVTLARGARIPGEIPFKLVHGFGIVVQGQVGPIFNLNFLVDTGAVPSVLSERVALRIGISGAKGPLALLDKDLGAEYVTVDDVRFGWVHARGLPMVVIDLESFSHFLGTRIDAIVGLDVLVRQAFSIDYKRRSITPGLSEKARHAVQVGIYFNWDAPYWVLPVTLGGQIRRVLLDTGANGLVLFAGPSRRNVTELAGKTIRSTKLTGKIEGRTLQPSLLVMGDGSFQKQLAVELENQRGVALLEIDGVLGPTALGITRVEFDWEHKCLRWDAE